MSEETISERYAKALLTAAREQDAVSAISHGLTQFHKVVQESLQLQHLMTKQWVRLSSVIKILREIAQELQSPPLIENFLLLLAHRRRLNLFSKIFATFQKQVLALNNEQVVYITSARPLFSEQKTLLQKKLENLTGKRIILEFHLRPEIIGGLIIRLGNYELDTSLIKRLQQIKQALRSVN